MGVKNLLPKLRESCGWVFRAISPDWREFKGKTLAVDVAIWMYRFWSNDPIFNNDRGKRISTLCKKFWNQYQIFKSRGIELIFVFDGPPPPEKAQERERRRITSEKRLEKKRKEAGEDETTDPVDVSSVKPTVEDYNLLREFMIRLLIPCIKASGEGEMGCTWLVYNGIADAVLTSDSDTLPCGAKIVIFDIPRKEPQWVILDDVLIGLGLTFEQFQDVCVLMGNDFNPRMPTIQFSQSITLIKRYGNLSKSLESIEMVPFLLKLDKKKQTDLFTPESTKRIFDVSQASPNFQDNDFCNVCFWMIAHFIENAARFKFAYRKRGEQAYDVTADRKRMYQALSDMWPNVDHSDFPSRPCTVIIDQEERSLIDSGKSVTVPEIASAGTFNGESLPTPVQSFKKRKREVILDDDEIAFLKASAAKKQQQ